MAEEFVGKEHFEEFSRRIAEGFLGVEKRMEQGFVHAEKARDQNLVHINQRFDGLEKRFDDLWKLQVVMLGGILAAAIAAVVKVFFFSS